MVPLLIRMAGTLLFKLPYINAKSLQVINCRLFAFKRFKSIIKSRIYTYRLTRIFTLS
jgi:hypothetical protein